MQISSAHPHPKAWSSRKIETRFDIAVTFIICILAILFGVLNNLAYFWMGQTMPKYPMFLLYAPSFVYIPSFGLGAWFIKRNGMSKSQDAYQPISDDPVQFTKSETKTTRSISTKRLHGYYCVLGFLSYANGILAQFSDPYVNGNLESLLGGLSIPLTGIMAILFLKHRMGRGQIIGSVIVMIGVAVSILPPLFTSGGSPTAGASKGWIICFALSIIPTAMTSVWEEYMFLPHVDAEPFAMLAWSNVYCTFMFLASVPLEMIPNFGDGVSWAQAWRNQYDAVVCLINPNEFPFTTCQPWAWVPLLGFTLCYVGLNYTQALLIQRDSAVFQVIVSAVVTPASAVAFTSSWINGAAYVEPLTWYVIVGMFVIPLGIVLYKVRPCEADSVLHEKAEATTGVRKPVVRQAGVVYIE